MCASKGRKAGPGLTRRSARLGVSTSDGSGSLVMGLFLLRRSHLCSVAQKMGVRAEQLLCILVASNAAKMLSRSRGSDQPFTSSPG